MYMRTRCIDNNVSEDRISCMNQYPGRKNFNKLIEMIFSSMKMCMSTHQSKVSRSNIIGLWTNFNLVAVMADLTLSRSTLSHSVEGDR